MILMLPEWRRIMVCQGQRIRMDLTRMPIRLDLEFTVGGKNDGCFLFVVKISHFYGEIV